MKSYVFSLNANEIAVDCGQFGFYAIKDNGGKIWGRTLIEDRKVPKDLGEDRFEIIEISGASIAKDIVQRNDEDGFFLCDGNEPTPQELKDAMDAFKNVCVYAVRNADVIWEKTRNREVIPERARRAARYLMVTPEWLDQVVNETKECPRCAESVKAKATACRFCGYDFNEPNKPPAPPRPAQADAKR